MARQKRERLWSCGGHSLRLRQSRQGTSLGELTLAGVPIAAASLSLRYRFLLTEPTAWRDLAWRTVRPGRERLLCRGDLVVNREYSFPLSLRVRPVAYAAPRDRRFTGLALQFAAERTVRWPVEIELSLPLGATPWRTYIQDLESPRKAAVTGRRWLGFAWDNWQAQRSPFDLFCGARGALWCRVNTLAPMLSSGARWVPGQGTVATYRFTFGSEQPWRSAEFALLFLPGRFTDAGGRELWADLFQAESARFRKQAGVQPETVLPMANIPIDGGTYGCAPPKQLKIQGTFDAFADPALRLCAAMNYKRLLVGSPWVSQRTEGIWFKALPNIAYDSRCGTLDIEVSPRYGGRAAFRRFCDRAHAQGVEVFCWYPAFHLSNFSPYLTQHPDWIVRKPDGSAFTHVYFHISMISTRLEVQRFFLARLEELKAACGFDGLWLDSFHVNFRTLDFYRRQGVSDSGDAIATVRRLQALGIRVINEGYAPFGARGDGETLYFRGQEDMALDTSLFTYQRNTDAVLADDCYFRFLANRAPLTLAAKYIRGRDRRRVAAWNAAYLLARDAMVSRQLLAGDRGVLWSDGRGTLVLFCFRDGRFALPAPGAVTDLVSGKGCGVRTTLAARHGRVYRIEQRASPTGN